MKEEWNENIELILASKTYEELTPEDKEVLGEIAEDRGSYDRYRQLFTTVLPAVKAEQVSTHIALDEKIESIADNKSRRGVWHQKWFQFSAAAAVLLLLFSSAFWFLNQNQIKNNKQERDLAHNEKKEMPQPENSEALKTEESAASAKKDSGKDRKPDVITESKRQHVSKSLDNSDAGEKERLISQNAEPRLDELHETETEAQEKYKVQHLPAEESLAASEDLSDQDAEMGYGEADEVGVFKGTYGSTVDTNQQASRIAAPANKKRDNLRNDIVGTLTLAKPASEDENAFKVLTIAF